MQPQSFGKIHFVSIPQNAAKKRHKSKQRKYFCYVLLKKDYAY